MRLLGVGGTGAVYEAETERGTRVAIKQLCPELAGDEQARARFFREARVPALVEHPAVVPVIDEGENDGAPYFVMELLAGDTLHGIRVRERRLDVRLVLRLLDAVLDFCECAHARGIVHCDLKPANLFLCKNGRLRVLDLGIVHIPQLLANGSLGSGRALLGTPGYMSPEQARADWSRVDARSDLWAVGATAFELLSGEPVHPARTAEEQRELATVVPPRSLSAVAGDLPRAVVRLVDRALAFDRRDRWSTATEMRTQLRRIERSSSDAGRVRSSCSPVRLPGTRGARWTTRSLYP